MCTWCLTVNPSENSFGLYVKKAAVGLDIESAKTERSNIMNHITLKSWISATKAETKTVKTTTTTKKKWAEIYNENKTWL